MRQYYIYKNDQRSGPFTKEELKGQNITKTTPVWYDGLADWTAAYNIQDLQDVWVVEPPMYQPQSAYSNDLYEYERQKKSASRKIVLNLIGILVLLGLVGFAVYVFVNNKSADYPQEKTYDAKEDVANNIEKYISYEVKYRYNSDFGGISDVVVYVHNKSSYYINNVTIRLEYILKNGRTFDVQRVKLHNIQPFSNKIEYGASSNRGVKISSYLDNVQSSELGL